MEWGLEECHFNYFDGNSFPRVIVASTVHLTTETLTDLIVESEGILINGFTGICGLGLLCVL